MTRRVFLLLISVAFLLLLGGCESSKRYSADRFDVDALLAGDGSMQVTETVVFRFVGGPFTYVYRDLPSEYTDGIQDVVASMDGVTLPPGRSTGEVELEGSSSRIKVTWHFAPTADSVHTFVLKYRLAGVVRQEVGADRLLWDALPDEHEYAITSATVRVSYPASARLLPGSVAIRRGDGRVTTAAGSETFTAQDLRADQPLRVEMRFAPGSLTEVPPAWQVRSARQLETAPYFGAAALGVLVIGLLGLAAWWNANRREANPRLDGGLRPTAPPGDLPPAAAGALSAAGAQPAWSHAVAALFDLARRGVVSIEESSERKWYRRRDFIIRLDQQPGDAGRPHERGLLELLFTTKAGMATRVTLSDLQGKLRSRWKLFTEPLKQEMQAAGLLDPAREAVRSRLLVLGVVLLLLLAPGMALGILLLGSFGGWPFLILAALFLLSMAAFIMSSAYSPLSEAGVEKAAAWRGFSEYLRDVTRGREPAWDLRQFERYLPYAAGFGLAEKWAKAFQQRGGAEIPAWFHTLAATPEDGLHSFVAFTAASHSVGSSGGAGAGGGAAGGGGSGAG